MFCMTYVQHMQNEGMKSLGGWSAPGTSCQCACDVRFLHRSTPRTCKVLYVEYIRVGLDGACRKASSQHLRSITTRPAGVEISRKHATANSVGQIYVGAQHANTCITPAMHTLLIEWPMANPCKRQWHHASLSGEADSYAHRVVKPSAGADQHVHTSSTRYNEEQLT